jgi:hypothetical protein
MVEMSGMNCCEPSKACMGGSRRLAAAVKASAASLSTATEGSFRATGEGDVTISGRPLEACPRKVEGMTIIRP